MQIVRVTIWVLLLVGLLLFSIFNWSDVTVRIWENIVVDTKLPAIVIVSFAIGFVPMWLYYRGSKWQASRKIASLENAARTAAATPFAAPEPVDASEAVETVTTPEPAPEPAAEPKYEPTPGADIADSDSPLSPTDEAPKA